MAQLSSKNSKSAKQKTYKVTFTATITTTDNEKNVLETYADWLQVEDGYSYEDYDMSLGEWDLKVEAIKTKKESK